MKIIGFTHYAGSTIDMVLKGDSSLLVNRKPLFVPDWTQDIRYTPAMVLRVSRLGKNIAEEFASRYYDAVAPAYDFMAYDRWMTLKDEGKSWTSAIGFDYSLAVGKFVDQVTHCMWEVGNTSKESPTWLLSPQEAIHQVSQLMTIRQGDYIFIDAECAPKKIEKEQVLQVEYAEETLLYCKIK